MDWKDVLGVIADKAPAAGALFGGPGGALAGGALKFVANAFGIKSPNPKPEEVITAIQADPQAVLKLEMARIDFEKERMRLDYEEKDKARNDEIEKLKVIVGDVQSARNMATEQTKATGKRDINLYVLAYLFILGFFGSIITMLVLTVGGYIKGDIPQAVVFLLGSLFGTLTAGVGAIIQYFFGSSVGSKEKNAMIFNSTPIAKKGAE